MIKQEYFFTTVEDSITGLPYQVLLLTNEKQVITGKENFPFGEIFVVHSGDYSSYYTATSKLISHFAEIFEYEI